eukprot:4205350-Pleurochrysis_carterae.AAC.4
MRAYGNKTTFGEERKVGYAQTCSIASRACVDHTQTRMRSCMNWPRIHTHPVTCEHHGPEPRSSRCLKLVELVHAAQSAHVHALAMAYALCVNSRARISSCAAQIRTGSHGARRAPVSPAMEHKLWSHDDVYMCITPATARQAYKLTCERHDHACACSGYQHASSLPAFACVIRPVASMTLGWTEPNEIRAVPCAHRTWLERMPRYIWPAHAKRRSTRTDDKS